MRKTLGQWVKTNKIPIQKLIFLDKKTIFNPLKKNIGESMLPGLFAALTLPIPSKEVIDAFEEWSSLPVVPIFTSLIDGCLSLVNKDTAEAEVLELLNLFPYH